MKVPWSDQTTSLKLIAIFATGLLISLGLCGLNMVLFGKYGAVSGPAEPPGSPHTAGRAMALILTGSLELLVIFISALGLLVTGIALIVRYVASWFSKRDNHTHSSNDDSPL